MYSRSVKLEHLQEDCVQGFGSNVFIMRIRRSIRIHKVAIRRIGIRTQLFGSAGFNTLLCLEFGNNVDLFPAKIMGIWLSEYGSDLLSEYDSDLLSEYGSDLLSEYGSDPLFEYDSDLLSEYGSDLLSVGHLGDPDVHQAVLGHLADYIFFFS